MDTKAPMDNINEYVLLCFNKTFYLQKQMIGKIWSHKAVFAEPDINIKLKFYIDACDN